MLAACSRRPQVVAGAVPSALGCRQSASAASWVAAVVVVLQILVPLALAWPAWRVEDPRADAARPIDGRRRGRRRRPTPAPPPSTPRTALCCTKCKAPLPLLAESFPCHYCGTPTTPPPEYVGGIVAARRAGEDLARAETVWRWSRLWSGAPFVWAGRLFVVAWLVVVIVAAVALAEVFPVGVLALAVLVAIVQVFFGLAVFSALRSMRAELPPLPPRAAMHVPPEIATCMGCGSPLAFAADRFSSVCGYCTAVQYRLALAHAAHDEAKGREAAAAHSLLDGMRALATKRFEMAGAVVLTGVAVVFYAVVLVVWGVGRAVVGM